MQRTAVSCKPGPMIDQKIIQVVQEKIKRFEELEEALQDHELVKDREKFRILTKEFRDLHKVKDLYEAYRKVETSLEQAMHVFMDESTDSELKTMAQTELEELRARRENLLREFEELLVKKDPLLSKNAMIEVRAGTGGMEASLFASEIFRMYTRYAASHNFKIEILSQQSTEAGGMREIIFLVTGEGVFGRFKFESGVHRVQRVPKTEGSGRIHTSAVTVAVLPEAEEVEVEIKPDELRVDVFRSGGPGGQSVNTTDSAVRVTHVPTGLVVKCQDEKSQLKNKSKAMKILRARLFDFLQRQQTNQLAEARRKQVGTGDRSEKIRTYNFPDRRVTDHRINLTLHRLERILEGDLDEIVDTLLAKERELNA